MSKPSTIVFTICSNNYLAHAKTLVDSVLEHNPSVKCFIGLVDEKSESIDYGFFEPATVINLNSIIVPGFDDMVSRFNIVELNTAVKPFLFEFLIKEERPDCIYYFDPDIQVFAKLDWLNELLTKQSAVITPHFFTPLPIDGKEPFENMALNYGIYNLGFIGLNANHAESISLLKWWGERTSRLGYSRVSEGLFVDQLWINLVPLFFKDVMILPQYACNMAPWNLHERKIAVYHSDSDIELANGERLVFYHFSSFDFKRPGLLSKYYDRFDFTNLPEIKRLYDNYTGRLLQNKATEFIQVKCSLPIITYEPTLKHKLAKPLLDAAKAVWKKI